MAMPLEIGSFAPDWYNTLVASAEPRSQVKTTAAAVKETISGWPKDTVTGIAKATVTDRGTKAREIAGVKPMSRPKKAVENIANVDVPTKQVKISNACRLIIFLAP